MPNDRLSWNVRFGEFEADLISGELFREGKRLEIQNKPFRILEVLLRSNGELVERERMMGEVWPEVHVGQRSINTAIRKLRRTLGDNADHPRLIETVGSRGHRLMVPAQVRSWAEDGRGQLEPTNVAIMPFQNLGTPNDELFSSGLMEELIVQLRRVPQGLSVIVPSEAKKNKGSRRLSLRGGRGMRIDYFLNGSVLPGARNLRITARLIRAQDQLCLWSESYTPKKGDVLAVQDEITRQIARAVLQTLPLPLYRKA